MYRYPMQLLLIRARLAFMVLAVLVEIVPVNDKRVDMPRLASIRSGHAGFSRTMVGNRVLKGLVCLAQRDGNVLPRVVAQSTADVLVAFVAGVEVLGVDGFVCTVSHITPLKVFWISKTYHQSAWKLPCH